MQIRPYRESDEEAVIQLWDSCGLIAPQNDPVQDIARKLTVDRELFLVGEENNRLMASVMGGYDGHRGWVNYLAVAPESQAHGWGRAMMEAVELKLVGRGCQKVNLQIRSKNSKVIDFYHALGFIDDDVVSLGKRLDGCADKS